MPAHPRPCPVAAGLSIVEVMITLAIMAVLAAALTSAIAANDRLRTSVAQSQESLAFQNNVLQHVLSVPVGTLMTDAWATSANGYAQAITEAQALDPALDVRSASVTQLTDAGILLRDEQALAGLRLFVQYHWAITEDGRRGLLDTGSDGADADSAPDPWPTAEDGQAALRDEALLRDTLLPDGPASVESGKPFVVRVVMAWDDQGRGDIAGSNGSSSATNAAQVRGVPRTATLMTVRTR